VPSVSTAWEPLATKVFMAQTRPVIGSTNRKL
jgi:hypothetical protein